LATLGSTTVGHTSCEETSVTYYIINVPAVDVVLRWVPPQLQQFDLQSQAKLQEMSAVDVSLLLEAFKVYGFAPSQAWLQQFAGG